MADNLLVNPGFEAGADGWTLWPWDGVPPYTPDLTEIVSTPTHSGGLALGLYRREVESSGGGLFIWASGKASQTFATTVGRVYPVGVWLYGSRANGVAMAFLVNGTITATTGPVAGWFLWSPPPFTATAATTTIGFMPYVPVNRLSRWYVDDVMVGMEAAMQRHRHLVVSTMVDVLKTIGGANYWSTLGGRVYTKFRTPAEIGDTEFPILFVVEVPNTAQFRNDDHVLKSTVVLRIVGLVKETSTNPLVSTAMADVNQLRDDVMRVLLGNLKLNGKLGGQMLFVDEEFDYGVDPLYAGFRLDVACPYYFTAAELGPLAV